LKIGVLNPPQFAPASRVVAIRSLGAGAKHLRPACGPAAVTINGVLWALRISPSFAICPGTSSSFHATERSVFQTSLAGLLVERHVILQIGPVHRQDQQILELDRRRRRAAVMAASQILTFPEHPPRGRIQTRRPKAAEMYVQPAPAQSPERASHNNSSRRRFRVAPDYRCETSFCLKRIFPLSASTPMAKKSWPSSVAVVTQTCPPNHHGVDQPR